MKKKVRLISILVIAVVVAIIVIWGAIALIKIDKERKDFGDLYFGVAKDQSVSYVAYNPTSETGGIIFNNKYLCVVKENREGDNLIPNVHDKQGYHSTYTYYFYSLETGELVYEYNLEDYYEKHYYEFPIKDFASDKLICEQDQPIYIKCYREDKELCINVETGESFVQKEGYRVTSKNWISPEGFSGRKSGTNLFEQNGLGNVSIDAEDKYCLLDAKDLPKENEALYEMFPELEDIRTQEGMRVVLYFEELDTELVLELLTEHSKVNYEECVIYAHSSKDGKEHIVNSKEEFDLYYEEVEYQQVVENHKEGADVREDHLPPYLDVDVVWEDGRELDIYAMDDSTDSTITVRLNGRTVFSEVSKYASYELPKLGLPYTVEVIATDANGNFQSIEMTDVEIKEQEQEEVSDNYYATDKSEEEKPEITKVRVVTLVYYIILGVLIITLILFIILIHKEEAVL